MKWGTPCLHASAPFAEHCARQTTGANIDKASIKRPLADVFMLFPSGVRLLGDTQILASTPSCIIARQSTFGDKALRSRCVAIPGMGTHNFHFFPTRICRQQ